MIRDRKAILIRAYVVAAVFLLLAVALVVKMMNIQFHEPEKYRNFAQENNFRLATVKGERGNLYASNGILLATTIVEHHIYVDLVAIKDTIFNSEVFALADSLGGMFNKPASYFEDKLKRERAKGNRYMLLVKGLDYEDYQRIKSFPIFELGQNRGGFIHETEAKRILTADDVGMRTVGYDDHRGRAGLEGAYSELLTGTDGQRLERKLGQGNWRPIDEWISLPINGANVFTTIDVDMQNAVYDALYTQLQEFQADHGCAIVMEVATGKVRAMVNLKNVGDSLTYKDIQNYAIWESAEPGSTIKSMVLLAGMEAEKWDTATVVETGRGTYRINGRTIRDSHANGTTDVMGVLEQSSNVGVVKLTQQHYAKKPKELFNQFSDWKLDKPLGVDIPGEGSPEIPNPKSDKWSKQTLASFSFGYETKLTPLQILTFYNGVANNGKLLKPLFIDKIQKKGTEEKIFQPVVLNQQMAKPENITKLQKMLENVVENGTAENIKTPYYTSAGKTGTAKVEYWLKDRPQQYMASYAGYFPADKPLYSCYIMVYKPNRSKGFYGSQVAAPVFKKIADRVYGATPKKIKPVNQKRTQEFQTAILQQSEFQLKENQNTIPNLVGKNASEVIPALENLGLIVKYTGIGKVKEQSLEPGTRFKKGNVIYLNLES